MRNNQPVSNREMEVLDDQAIVSKTDLSGNIVYVNPYFTQISGYSEAELLGAPQNIVRHPDMPPEAFADLWDSIKGGTPWTGIVKNRCKNGDYYWVRANVTPIRENGKTTGYMSVRVKPARAQIDSAEQAYRALREGGKHGIRIKNGQVIRSGAGTLLSRLSHVSLAMRIWLATSVVNVLQVIVCAAALMGGRPQLRHLRHHLCRPADQRLPVVHHTLLGAETIGARTARRALDRRRRPVVLVRHRVHRRSGPVAARLAANEQQPDRHHPRRPHQCRDEIGRA